MLEINYKKGKYELKGSLILESSQGLLSYFKTLIKYDSDVVLSLKELNHIDNTGIDTLKELSKIAIKNNKKFTIFKKVNEKLSWVLNEPKLKEVLKE
ncbi:STAS domain-containing protein [Tenacibaculum sp. MAR_2009_124]|uniref:STAS domain-containing protein n=1 Tax=Tenacibaculum sp. MAR_2009_124 TaxID=1250059 RepID=UPI00089D5B2B|nr:STAS domain-containing protein [Tenacibaculum sp. MAR_2009_124]SEB50734.1 STAS domain-containing protein [Tenacibaculum sp. MAR_2009_124]